MATVWPRMLRNWSKWSILFRSHFSKWNFSKFCFDYTKILINFDRFALRNRHRNFSYDRNSSKFFQKILILRPTIEKDRNLFRSISILRPTIEIFRNSFRSFSIKKRSKFFQKILKLPISFWISFRFISKTRRNGTPTEVSQHPDK